MALVTTRCDEIVKLLHFQGLLEQRVLKVENADFLPEAELVPLDVVEFDGHGTQLLILHRDRLKLSELAGSIALFCGSAWAIWRHAEINRLATFLPILLQQKALAFIDSLV